MDSLPYQAWIPENRKTVVCIDSYRDGIFRGRFFTPEQEVQIFDSLSQFLVMMDEMLERNQNPRSDTRHRSFSAFLLPYPASAPAGGIRKGRLATFELQILFRQHASWQGVLLWREQQQKQCFRSVLELILLMDSALRDPEGKETA